MKLKTVLLSVSGIVLAILLGSPYIVLPGNQPLTGQEQPHAFTASAPTLILFARDADSQRMANDLGLATWAQMGFHGFFVDPTERWLMEAFAHLLPLEHLQNITVGDVLYIPYAPVSTATDPAPAPTAVAKAKLYSGQGRSIPNPSEFQRWLDRATRVFLMVVSQTPDAFTLSRAIGPSRTVGITTFNLQDMLVVEAKLGDVFIARDIATDQEIARHTALYDGPFIVRSTDPAYHCDIDSGCADPTKWNKIGATSPEQLKKDEDLNEARRVRDAELFPRIVPRFSRVGFQKVPIPAGAWRAIQEYYENNRDELVVEVWAAGFSNLNHKERPVLHVPWPLVDDYSARVTDEVMPILEEWSGRKLRLSSCYGVRVYLNGSRLLKHVDIPWSHPVSAILHVDHDGEPWPLQINDHEGNEHSIVLEAGEMLLYEGGRCAHGREIPFKGRYFANFFVHTIPSEDWDSLALESAGTANSPQVQ